MTPERWQQVARVYQSALEQAPAARDTFVASVTTEPQVSVGNPEILPGGYSGGAYSRGRDVMPEGKRFVVVVPSGGLPVNTRQIQVVQNWFEELKQRVPAR